MANKVWTKHRLAGDVYSVDFVDELAAGETISAPVVTITRRGVNRTTEFVGLAPQVSGTEVRVRLKPAAAATEQQAGVYVALVTAATSADDTVSEVLTLSVSAEGQAP